MKRASGMTMSKAFIFDWSGTLSNNFDCVYKCIALMFQDLGREPLTEQEFKVTFTTPYMRFWAKYFPALTKEYQNQLYNKHIHEVGEPELYSGAKEIINYLFIRGYKLFIVSSDPLTKLLPEVEKSGMSSLFTEVIGDVHEKKHAIALLIEKFSLDKNATYYIGDTDGDIEAGKIVNIKTIAISWGFQAKEVLAKSIPDYLIDDLKEIENIAQ